jgi:signal peptidase I
MIVEEKIGQRERKANEFAKGIYRSLLRKGKSIYVNIWGMSMYPFIKSGDRLKIVPQDAETIKIGDIIAVYRRGKEGAWFLAHRVLKITGDEGHRIYFTKGDARKRGLDSPITRELIAGKITQIQRGNLKLNLEFPLWRYLNRIIAQLSLRYPNVLHFLSLYISLVIEWRLFFSKVKNRLKKGNPILYNTEELLLICSRKDLSQELKKEAISLINEGVDWQHFLELAMTGGVTVLVYNALKNFASDVRIPQFVFEKLKSAYLFITSRIISQYQQLREILKLFARENIPVVPLKGTLLAERLYGDIAARGLSVDIDLFVKWEDRENVHKILIENGYEFLPNEEIKQWLWQETCSPRSRNLRYSLDIIYDIWLRGYNKQVIAGLWDGIRRVSRDNNLIYYEFKEEEFLVYAAVYLLTSDNGYRCLKYACDINAFLNLYKYKFNWNDVINKAKRWRLSSSLYAALITIKNLFGSNIPLFAIESIKPQLLKRIFIKLFFNRKAMLRENFRRRLMDGFLKDIFFELIEARSVKEYLAIFQRVFFPPKEIMGNRSYILRIFKGITKKIKTKF